MAHNRSTGGQACMNMTYDQIWTIFAYIWPHLEYLSILIYLSLSEHSVHILPPSRHIYQYLEISGHSWTTSLYLDMSGSI